MTLHVIETITFRLAEPISDAEFLDRATASTQYIKSCKGFVARRLSADSDGQWVEQIEWESLKDAKAAAAGLGEAANIAPFLTAIHPGSVTMHHTDLKLSLNSAEFTTVG